MKRRHKVFYAILQPLVSLFLKIRFGYKFICNRRELPPNYIVLSNHATDYDVVLVGAALRRQMYFVASEHIARWGWLYRVLDFVFAPIVRYKGASAGGVVMDVLRRTRKGHSVCIFAEGVRTWDGVTCPILPSTAQLCRAAGCGLVTFHLSGGYFASPMWGGASVRRGELRGEVRHVLTKEQLRAMSDEEIYRLICEDLYEDAYARQLAEPKRYRSRKGAEHLERLLFRCPDCSATDSFVSKGDTVTCMVCDKEIRYDEYGMLHGSRFRTLKEFSDWQKTEVLSDLARGVSYTAADARLITVDKHTEAFVTSGPLSMSRDAVTVGELRFSMEEIVDLAMHGQRALVFTAGKTYYELLPSEESNALKFFLFWSALREQRLQEKVMEGKRS